MPTLTYPLEWYEYLANALTGGGEIYDEYGKVVPLHELIALVVAKRDSKNRNSRCWHLR